MGKLFVSSKVGVIVTGASRGFGVALATVLAKHYQAQLAQQTNTENTELTLVLLARSENHLQTVARELGEIHPKIKVHHLACDLSRSETTGALEEFLQTIQLFDPKKNYGQYILLHNAGSIGDANLLCKSISSEKTQQRNDYYRLNLFSVMELTGYFIRQTEILKSTRHIINISSLAGIQPFPGLVDYCVGKASREAYFRSLVHELNEDKNNRSIRVLNYAPGPLETEMFNSLCTNSLVSEAFQQIVPLTSMQSAEKLVKVLESDSFTNGAHIDYYDVE